jgi:hypothetical protein
MVCACAFYHRRIPIHDVMYQTYVARYCESNCEGCAIFQVLKAASFLNVPKDLYPNQTFRVAEILKKAVAQ